ncbi:MAG: mitochondrial fission ELM1 family protein [Rhodobacteraceae bacterium]|nr:mitochondrial fission ELM1 family protein [Paracoccaceae bacterium]
MAYGSVSPLIWVLTDDRPGNTTQALGVAEALGLPFSEKKVEYDSLAVLPNILRGATMVGVSSQSRSVLLGPPWPDLVIAAGRRLAPVSRWIRRVAHKPVRLVHLMNPGRVRAGAFDLIAVPRHDGALPGGEWDNVLRVTGAPHRFSRITREVEAEAWRNTLSGLPRPYIALLVGGATRHRPFPADYAGDLGRRVAEMARSAGGSVLLATSRRTGADAERALDAAIPEPRSAYFWSRGGENPYFGFLALADAVVVTGDSVSMCSEACATPGPVYIDAPAKLTAEKHRILHSELYSMDYARPFIDSKLAMWTHPPLNAAVEIAAAIIHLLKTPIAVS